MKDLLLKLIFNILKNYKNFIMIYHFSLKGLLNKTKYIIHIRFLNQALNHELVF